MALLAGLSSAQLEWTTEERKIRKSEVPKVERDGDCSNFCVFKDMTNKWCYDTTPPMVEVGWKWEQTYAQTADSVPVKFYSLKFLPYANLQGYLK